jgi:hypothetical protein
LAEAPLLRFALADGRPATLLLGEASTVLSVEETLVSSWDLAGRPYALVREGSTFRRALDGGLLEKGAATAESPRLRRRLSAAEGAPVVEAARLEAEAAIAVLTAGTATPAVATAMLAASMPGAPARASDGPVSRAGSGTMRPAIDRGQEAATAEAVRRLGLVVAMDAAALRADAERFLAVCGRVGILPPDQYLSLVVRVTEGCSWNACSFCGLYAGVPFRAKGPDELRAHLRALEDYFGPSLALRRSVFLGDANALCLATERLLPLVEIVAQQRPRAPLFSFVDAWTGHRKTAGEWRTLAHLGLGRVYVGLETGDAELLAWLGKPGSPQDAVSLVLSLHAAGIAAGVIVLVGAGGRRFAAAHARGTAEALSGMRLGSSDIVYFSDLVEEPGLEYAQRAAGHPELRPLDPAAAADQRASIVAGFRPGDPAGRPRTATYDIREFVY